MPPIRCAHICRQKSTRGRRCPRPARPQRQTCSRHRQYDQQAFEGATVDYGDFKPFMNCALKTVSIPNLTPHALEERIPCPACGALLWPEEGAKIESLGGFRMCCDGGKLSKLPIPVAKIQPAIDMLKPTHPDSKHFRANIRGYSSVFSVASFNAKHDPELAKAIGGQHNFRIHGAVHHLLGNIHEEPMDSQFGGIYFHSPEDQLRTRHHLLSHLKIAIIESIQHELLAVNPYVKSYQNLASIHRIQGPTHYIHLNPTPTYETGQDGAAQIGEVGVILQGDGTEAAANRQLAIVVGDSETLKYVKPISPHYDALVYLLLFPRGFESWHPEYVVKSPNNQIVHPSLMQFYR